MQKAQTSKSIQENERVETAQERLNEVPINAPGCSQPFIWGCLAIVEDFMADSDVMT
jgi:hypothetical protein